MVSECWCTNFASLVVGRLLIFPGRQSMIKLHKSDRFTNVYDQCRIRLTAFSRYRPRTNHVILQEGDLTKKKKKMRKD